MQCNMFFTIVSIGEGQDTEMVPEALPVHATEEERAASTWHRRCCRGGRLRDVGDVLRHRLEKNAEAPAVRVAVRVGNHATLRRQIPDMASNGAIDGVTRQAPSRRH